MRFKEKRLEGSSTEPSNQKRKLRILKKIQSTRLLISVGPCGGGFVCLKYWFDWCWFAFGAGGLLDSDLIPLHETAAGPNLAIFQRYIIVLRKYSAVK